MTDFNSTVVAKGTGAFGTFTVTEGVVKKGVNILSSFFGDKLALIPTNARATFTLPAEHQLFDGLMFALMTAGIAIEYVDNVRTFLNPKLRFDAFLKMNAADATAFNTKYELGLTPQEIQVVTTMKAVETKIGAKFNIPGNSVPITLDDDAYKVFEIQHTRIAVKRWVEGGALPEWSVRRRFQGSSQNLLRVSGSGARKQVQTMGGNNISVIRFKAAYELFNNRRDDAIGTYIGDIRHSQYDDSRATIKAEGVLAVGCQDVLFSEIDRIAAILEL